LKRVESGRGRVSPSNNFAKVDASQLDPRRRFPEVVVVDFFLLYVKI